MFTYRLLKYEKGNAEWTRVPNMLVPLTDKETLDETLDFSVIVVKNVPYGEAFEPLTRFKIECRSDDVLFDTIYRVMAIDTVDQIMFGDNPLYRHEITLIEPTKILEGYICDNLTFTNPLSGPKKSLADVIDRLFDVTPTRFANTAPIFKLDTAIRAKLAAIVAPEFSFTGATLFEALLEIGGYIHAIPRLIPDPDNDRAYDTVTYDFLDTAEEYSYEGIRHNAYREEYSIDQYCDDIDSTIENAVMTNKDDTASVIDPYYDGVSFVRTEEVNIRLTEDNMFIPTNRPIYDLVKVEMWITNGSAFKSKDITQWVIEKALYETKNNFLLESDSKLNYFYFVQGQKNIYGLNFSSQFLLDKFYAWRQMWDKIADIGAYIPNLENMFFRVTYKTFVNMRVKQQKLNSYGHNNYNDINGQNNRSLVYNQQSNSISTYAYGRNMYGVAQKLGNRGKLVTYKFATINTPFPKVGQLTSDGYVVTTVGKEFRLEWIKVSVELSKDFNRLSSYVGLNSRRRFYEISEKMAVNRYMNVSGYVGIGDTNGTGFNRGGSGFTPHMGELFKMALLGFRFASEKNNRPLSSVVLKGIKDNVASKSYLLAPAVSVIGNSIAINIATVDNFSIGSKAIEKNNQLLIQPVEYPQFDAVKLTAFTNISGFVPDDLLITRDNAMALPEATKYIESKLDQDYKLLESPLINVNKDTRETLNITYQLHFLAKNDNIIVNSNFANFYPIVAGLSGRRCYLMYLNKRLSPFAETVDSSTVVYSKTVIEGMIKDNGDMILIEDTVTQECKAVALCDADNNVLVGINKEQMNGDKSYVSFHFNN